MDKIEALNTVDILLNLLKNVEIYEKKDDIDSEVLSLDFAISVVGFDFASIEDSKSVDTLNNKLSQKLIEALEESEVLGKPTVYYE